MGSCPVLGVVKNWGVVPEGNYPDGQLSSAELSW